MASYTITLTSDASIVDASIFTYSSIVAATDTVITNYTAFDVQLKHTCNHKLGASQYTLSKCPRCLGKGYYYDIQFNAAGKILEVSLVDKLAQTLEKFVLTESNDFHPEVAINVAQWLGGSPISEIKAVIKFELSKSLMALISTQRGVPNLASEAQIAKVNSIDVYDDVSDPGTLNYGVTVTTIAGGTRILTGSIIFSG